MPDGESQGTVNRNAGSNLWCATTSLAWIAFWILVLFMRKCLRAAVRSTASPPFGAWRVSQLHLFSWRRNSGIATTGLFGCPRAAFSPSDGHFAGGAVAADRSGSRGLDGKLATRDSRGYAPIATRTHSRPSTIVSRVVSMRCNVKIYPLTIAMCAVSFVVTAAFAQTPSSGTKLTENLVYKKDCAKCHGKTAEGRHFGGPSLISNKTAAASVEDLRNIIANGKGRMPKYTGKLTPEEIDSLVQQIRAVNGKKTAGPTRYFWKFLAAANTSADCWQRLKKSIDKDLGAGAV